MSHLMAILQAQGHDQLVEHLCRMQPIVKSIRPHVAELRVGLAQISAQANDKNARANGTLCDGALCAVAALATDLMLDASAPTGASWAKRGMSATFLSAAKHEVNASADGGSIDWAQGGDQVAKVTLKDGRGEIVCEVEMTLNIVPA